MQKKRTGPSRGMKLGIFLLLLILVLSSVLVIFNMWTPRNYIAQPSPSDFAPKEWMQFIPSNIQGFRFLNMSSLSKIANLFQSDLLLNLTTLGMNITIHDVRYGLDMQNDNGSIINIMAVGPALAEAVSSALSNSSHVRHDYHGTTLYAVPPNASEGTEGYWICVNRGAIVICEGGDLAFAALKSVVDADTSTFFSTNDLKVAYMITSRGRDNFIFTYYTAGGNNTYNVDWLMGGASNSTNLDIRISYHFQTQADLERNYGDFTSSILSDAKAVYTSVTFLIGDFSYAQSKIRDVLMSL